MQIPLFRPVVSEEAIKSVVEVLRSGWLGLGPKTEAFERKFADYIGVPYCVGLNSCTAALHLGLSLLDLKPGSEVITTALTFISTNHAILYNKLKPVFADIQPETGNLDVNSVSRLISEKTGAIMLMHYGGYPCDLDEFYALSLKHKIPIIEDCAHACGAIYKNKRIGSHGEIHAFSFHAVKNLTAGDGGALTVKSEKHYLKLKKLRWLGIDKDTFQRNSRQAYDWDYDVNEIGFKYQMNDINAAIALSQLPYLEQQNARRAEIASLYAKLLSNVPGVNLLKYKTDRKSSFHLFCILAENRDGLMKKLRQNGVAVSVHYRRNDLYPMYEKRELPNAERFWRSVISLPMHIALTDEQIDYITDIIKKGW